MSPGFSHVVCEFRWLVFRSNWCRHSRLSRSISPALPTFHSARWATRTAKRRLYWTKYGSGEGDWSPWPTPTTFATRYGQETCICITLVMSLFVCQLSHIYCLIYMCVIVRVFRVCLCALLSYLRWLVDIRVNETRERIRTIRLQQRTRISVAPCGLGLLVFIVCLFYFDVQRATYALVCETMKYKSAIDRVLDQASLRKKVRYLHSSNRSKCETVIARIHSKEHCGKPRGDAC